jgi:hypothetical protein
METCRKPPIEDGHGHLACKKNKLSIENEYDYECHVVDPTSNPITS